MIKAWIYYLDNNERKQVLVTTQSNDMEQLKHNGMSLARHYYSPGTQLVFDNVEILESIG